MFAQIEQFQPSLKLVSNVMADLSFFEDDEKSFMTMTIGPFPDWRRQKFSDGGPEERDLQSRADHGSQVHQRPHPDR